jgi:hypothetical protein
MYTFRGLCHCYQHLLVRFGFPRLFINVFIMLVLKNKIMPLVFGELPVHFVVMFQHFLPALKNVSQPVEEVDVDPAGDEVGAERDLG